MTTQQESWLEQERRRSLAKTGVRGSDSWISASVLDDRGELRCTIPISLARATGAGSAGEPAQTLGRILGFPWRYDLGTGTIFPLVRAFFCTTPGLSCSASVQGGWQRHIEDAQRRARRLRVLVQVDES